MAFGPRGGFVRRRPLLRTAALGGGAYMAGRSAARRSAEQAQRESDQNARISDLEQAKQQPPVPQQGTPTAPTAPTTAGAPAAAPADAGGSMLDQLSKLAALHQQGALTDAEFSAAKAKLLGHG